jgi:enterochelin esterase-like enzyme
LQKLYASGKLPPSIVITPDGNDKRGSSKYWDPQYIDGVNGKVSTPIGNELVKIIQTRYRTLPNPDFWAMGGLSSGGWGAINFGLHNINNFSILFSHSGYFKDKSGLVNSQLVISRRLTRKRQNDCGFIWIQVSQMPKKSKKPKNFFAVLSQLKVYNLFRKFPGGHTWDYWRENLSNSLTFVGEQFKIAQIAHSTDNLNLDKPKPKPTPTPTLTR